MYDLNLTVPNITAEKYSNDNRFLLLKNYIIFFSNIFLQEDLNMEKKLSPKALAIVKKMQQNELTESVIYEEISKFAKGDENKVTLLRLSMEERAICIFSPLRRAMFHPDRNVRKSERPA